jgi:predicted HicB family RNase H-like nuclease
MLLWECGRKQAAPPTSLKAVIGMADKEKKPVSKAQQAAVARYENKAYDKFLVRVTKGKKDELVAHAAGQGESLNGFVNRAIDETVERDSGKNE